MKKPESAGSNYLKLETGNNRLRVMGQIIDGWEAWADKEGGGRQVYREADSWKALELVKMGVLDKNQKQFYAGIVWNYESEQFEVFCQTQKAIKDGIFNLWNNKVWGELSQYDIVISKTGSGMETKYSVLPEPKSKFKGDPYNAAEYCIENLYGAGDPFEVDEQTGEEVDFD